MLPQLASIELCCGCSACKAVCPKNAILMHPDKDGFLYPQVDEALCVGCHLCEKTCPVLHPGEPDINPKTYAAYTKDRELRLASSSGGLFTELAKPILVAGGVVFGCVWEKPAFVAIHAKAETQDELAEMRGSKYVQSDVRDTYREAKAELLKGRQVLYSGTPCQIAGLNAFLGKSYDNLLTVQIICHGTPAPGVFEKYKNELLREHANTPLVSIFFRNKKYSWRKFSLVSAFADTSENCADLYSDRYIRAFLSNLCLRPSCYTCLARENRPRADFTIADFWGIETVCPELDDNWGTSLVLCHTPKAEIFWQTLQSRLNAKEVDFAQALRGNSSYFSSVRVPKNRALFMSRYKTVKNIAPLVRTCIQGPWGLYMLKRIYGKARRILAAIKHRILG